MQPPGEIKDNSRAAGWLNKLLHFCISSRLVEGVGYRVSRTTRGTYLDIAPSKGSGSSLQQFRIDSIQNDFYTCHAWDGTQETGDEVYIARPFEQRVSNFHNQTIAYNSDGDSFSASYSYSSPTKRTKTISGTAETQVLIPLFKTGFTIIGAQEVDFALTAGPTHQPITDPNNELVTLLESSSNGRAWTKV